MKGEAAAIATSRAARLEQTRPRGQVSALADPTRLSSVTATPPPPLTDVIAAFWATAWDFRGRAPHTFELLGDPCVHVVFEAGLSRVVGVWTRCWRRTLEGQGVIRAAKLAPGAVEAFFAVPAHRLTDRVTPLRELFDDDVAALEDAFVGTAAADPEAFGRLGRWLERKRRPTSEDGARVSRLLAQVATQPELATVDGWARAAGLTVRRLQKLFREHVGASPKWVLRRHRLQEAAARLDAGAGPTLAEVAAELGYADQAHFTRDFRAATGRTPARFLRATVL